MPYRLPGRRPLDRASWPCENPLHGVGRAPPFRRGPRDELADQERGTVFRSGEGAICGPGGRCRPALERLAKVPISLHCWQGDDVGGFENTGEAIGGGLAVTGNYPGKARTPDELRADLDQALSLMPGTHRLNLHASYAETGGRKSRARRARARALPATGSTGRRPRRMGMDFNPTYFAHPWRPSGHDAGPSRRRRSGSSGSTTASSAGGSARRSARRLGTPCVTNVWIPDGCKDTPDRPQGAARAAGRVARRDLRRADRPEVQPRRRRGQAVRARLRELRRRLARVLPRLCRLAPEAALPRRRPLSPDRGRLRQDLGRALSYLDEILLHVSRGVRWDSDHVVILSDELEAIAQELVRGDYLGRVHIGLDFFDASINRVAAWVIGTGACSRRCCSLCSSRRNLAPARGRAATTTARLALLEELKTLPFGAVWDHYCLHARRSRRPRLAGGGQGLRARRSARNAAEPDRSSRERSCAL